jgi:hypothetical protein
LNNDRDTVIYTKSLLLCTTETNITDSVTTVSNYNKMKSYIVLYSVHHCMPLSCTLTQHHVSKRSSVYSFQILLNLNLFCTLWQYIDFIFNIELILWFPACFCQVLCYIISYFSLVSCSGLNLAVLDFTIQLVETGVENDVLLALIIFSCQYVLVNHEYWKYRIKHIRWKITLKVWPPSLLALLNFILL